MWRWHRTRINDIYVRACGQASSTGRVDDIVTTAGDERPRPDDRLTTWRARTSKDLPPGRGRLSTTVHDAFPPAAAPVDRTRRAACRPVAIALRNARQFEMVAAASSGRRGCREGDSAEARDPLQVDSMRPFRRRDAGRVAAILALLATLVQLAVAAMLPMPLAMPIPAVPAAVDDARFVAAYGPDATLCTGGIEADGHRAPHTPTHNAPDAGADAGLLDLPGLHGTASGRSLHFARTHTASPAAAPGRGDTGFRGTPGLSPHLRRSWHLDRERRRPRPDAPGRSARGRSGAFSGVPACLPSLFSIRECLT